MENLTRLPSSRTNGASESASGVRFPVLENPTFRWQSEILDLGDSICRPEAEFHYHLPHLVHDLASKVV